MYIRSILTTVAATMFFVSAGNGQAIKNKFETGNKKRYRLVLEEWHNEKPGNRVSSVCELSTIKDSGNYYEVVKWLSLVQVTEKGTLIQDSLAAKVKPYRIALDSGGKLEIPKIEVPEMTQPIQDFTTFFVAISPQLGITHLNRVGDAYEVPAQIKGDLANGSFILKGEDCFQVSLKYASLNRDTATIITAFQPPKETCLNYLLPEMDSSVIENVRNNIQMVMTSGDKVNVQYGVEEFTIESEVNCSTGALLSATMINTITFKMKINCSANYQDCAFQMPFKIVRKLKLEMLH